MDLSIVVPTRGDREATLSRLIQVGHELDAAVIVVNTNPIYSPPDDCRAVHDFGPINIHRWWNRGLNESIQIGSEVACVVNDDVEVTVESVRTLCESLLEHDASVATPGPSERLFQSYFPFTRRIIGSLWVVRPTDRIRPSEKYRWHFGDDDLDIRSRFHRRGLLTMPVGYRHLTEQHGGRSSPEILNLVQMDQRTFRREYPVHSFVRWSIARSQGRVGNYVRRRLATGFTEDGIGT